MTMDTPAEVFAVACLIVVVGLALTVLTWRFEQWLRRVTLTARRNAETRALRRMIAAEEALFLPFADTGLTPDRRTPIYDAVGDELAARRTRRGGAA